MSSFARGKTLRIVTLLAVALVMVAGLGAQRPPVASSTRVDVTPTEVVK